MIIKYIFIIQFNFIYYSFNLELKDLDKYILKLLFKENILKIKILKIKINIIK